MLIRYKVGVSQIHFGILSVISVCAACHFGFSGYNLQLTWPFHRQVWSCKETCWDH